MNIHSKLAIVFFLLFSLTGCVGTVVGAVVDTAIEVAKIPVKVVGAAVDVVTEDDFAPNDKKVRESKDARDIELKSETQGIE